MNPFLGHEKRGFYMSKLSYKDKEKIYKLRKEGKQISYLSRKYKVRSDNIAYLIRLIDKHGLEIIKKNSNNYYPPYQKEEIINRIFIGGESITSVAIDVGLSSDGILHNWIKKYKKKGYNVVERKRGRSPTMPKVTKEKKYETKDEKIKRLEEENLYLKAELEYSKKLRAVVQARKNQQQKKK